jgi:hypothetical protein
LSAEAHKPGGTNRPAPPEVAEHAFIEVGDPYCTGSVYADVLDSVAEAERPSTRSCGVDDVGVLIRAAV